MTLFISFNILVRKSFPRVPTATVGCMTSQSDRNVRLYVTVLCFLIQTYCSVFCLEIRTITMYTLIGLIFLRVRWYMTSLICIKILIITFKKNYTNWLYCRNFVQYFQTFQKKYYLKYFLILTVRVAIPQEYNLLTK